MHSFHCHMLYIVSRFARDKISPFVREMDDKSEMNQDIIKGLFDQGVRTYVHEIVGVVIRVWSSLM